MPRVLEGKIALITGGGRGIGRATALALAEDGARVCVAARTSAEIDQVAAEIKAAGGEGLASVADVTSYADCVRVNEQIAEAWGAAVDVLINNAGGGQAGVNLVDTDPHAWAGVVQLNLVGTYHMCRATLPGMLKRGSGRIVNVGSGLGYAAIPGVSAYGSSKAGVAMLTRALAEELCQSGIEVNEVIPGPVATKATEGIFTLGQPAGIAAGERVKTPEEAAELLRWLACRPDGGPTGQMFSLARRPLL